jgi:hypothetical protein
MIEKNTLKSKKYVEILKRAFENLFPMEFPDLEVFLDNRYDQQFTQKDLSYFLNNNKEFS